MKKTLLLLAAAAFFASCQNSALTVDAVNTTDLARSNETVEIAWPTIQQSLGSIEPQLVSVFNAKGELQTSQVLYKGTGEPQSLIFQANVEPQSSAIYVVKKGPANHNVDAVQQTYGRLVPERMDDFAWENNRLAFRMYGPALMAQDGPSSGIDVWCKRTEDLIINKWYKQDLAGEATYHVDHGEGVDCYKVGRTLGCGALAPYIDGKLVLGNNFVRSNILDSGALRISFELLYAPLDVAGAMVAEVRRISLDANSHFNRISEMFIGGKDMPVAMGIVLKDDKAVPAKAKKANPNFKASLNTAAGYVTYAEVADKLKDDTNNNGVIHTAIIAPELTDAKVEDNHVLALGSYKSDEPFTYYAGAGWSKTGFATEKDWQDYVAAEAQKLRNPIELRFK
ncbi:MAG: DUF4861 domain-containing protein [Prevotellaceae bacterium]|jgi:hypothetical protein|nr:DUF4861 domain-containing protein [Prevotellaceae bacterium]